MHYISHSKRCWKAYFSLGVEPSLLSVYANRKIVLSSSHVWEDGKMLNYSFKHGWTLLGAFILRWGPLTVGQWMYVRVGSGVPTDMLPWWLSSSFKPGSHLKLGLRFETEELGLCQATTRVSALAQKPTDDSYCEEMRRPSTCEARLSHGNVWKLLVAPLSPVPLPSPSMSFAASPLMSWDQPWTWRPISLQGEVAWKVSHQCTDGESEAWRERKDVTC